MTTELTVTSPPDLFHAVEHVRLIGRHGGHV
jgi:hypothetical protein